MRLAIVGPVKPWRGGIALHTGEMAAAARARGHEVRIVSYRRLYPALVFPGRSQLEPDAAPPAADDPLAAHLIDSLDPRSWRRAGSAVAAFGPDLVVLQRWHPFFAPALACVAALARRAGARIVWMVHNAAPHEGGAALWRPLLALGIRDSDTCLTHAGSEARRLAALGVRAPARTLVHPAPASLAPRADRAVSRRALGIGDREVTFLFFGHVRHYKGVDVLLRALALLDAAGPPWRAIVAGEWYVDRAAADRAIARPPLSARVQIVDRYLDDREVAELLAAADVVVLPYRAGTQSGVVPLAYAYERPVVTTRVGGLEEAVRDGETGILVAPNDPHGLARALEAVRRGSRFSSVAIKAALERAAWPTFVRVLEEIAAAPPPPA